MWACRPGCVPINNKYRLCDNTVDKYTCVYDGWSSTPFYRKDVTVEDSVIMGWGVQAGCLDAHLVR